MWKKNEFGFTLVELLAVIVILAIILVIAVPKVMNVIEDAKKATLESTAKMIASQAEKKKVQNQVLGKNEEITCESIVKINNIDYAFCNITFENNRALVTIEGTGKFNGLYVCNGTKTDVNVTNKKCGDTTILPEIGISAEDCTWEEITTIGKAGKADEYFNLGDTKTITLTTGEEIVMEIVAFNADEKVDGSRASITWISKYVTFNSAINSTDSNAGGWKESEIRTQLNNEFYNILSDELRRVIVNVNKTYYDYSTSSTLNCEDKIWIPSIREIYGNNYDDYGNETFGADYTNYFSNSTSRVKTYSDGSEAYWWVRSATKDDNECFHSIFNDGSVGNGMASFSDGVVIAFCTD